MLVLLPAHIARRHGLKTMANYVEAIKELGGVNRGLFYSYGFVFEFPDHLFDEWREILELEYFS